MGKAKNWRQTAANGPTRFTQPVLPLPQNASNSPTAFLTSPRTSIGWDNDPHIFYFVFIPFIPLNYNLIIIIIAQIQTTIQGRTITESASSSSKYEGNNNNAISNSTATTITMVSHETENESINENNNENENEADSVTEGKDGSKVSFKEANSSTSNVIRSPLDLLLEHVDCKLNLEVEPLFCTIALYDIEKQVKISENFHFLINSHLMTDHMVLYSPVRISSSCF
jgi:hypothetical protein